MNQTASTRIASIDILRGLVMIIMALDHVRDFFHSDAMLHDPMDLSTTTPALYFTRWITHYCAPVFVFLSGISAYLSGRKKTKNEQSIFLIKRGLILIAMEVTVVTFGWSFNPFFNILVFQVIWAIGASMIVLGLLVQLPLRWIGIISILILTGHNLIDATESLPGYHPSLISDLLHHGHFVFYPLLGNHNLLIVYPLLPWIGIMGLGYAIGTWYGSGLEAMRRKQYLILTGASMVIGFILLRMLNVYGDPHLRTPQPDFMFTLLNALDVTKYPPSLQFTCMTLGPALIFLAITENARGWAERICVQFGRVPFFFYLAHIYLIHILTVIGFWISGFGVQDIVATAGPFWFRPASFGVSLPYVYLIWMLVIVLLYYPCRWYDQYKSARKTGWTTYL